MSFQIAFPAPCAYIFLIGEVQEWLIWPPWKGGILATVSWVRIPPSPPQNLGKNLKTKVAQMFYAYILRSQKDGSYYYGSTEQLNTRLATHNSGKVRYTKGHLPYTLQYFECRKTRKEAFARESFFKSIDGYNWLRANKIIE
jgi:putative endonuclease